MWDKEVHDVKKKAIFDGMSKRGQKWVLKIGYETWDPFQEPKDPRDRIFGSASLRASALVSEFFTETGCKEESVSMHKELFELCRGLLQDEDRAKAIFAFCDWYGKRPDKT
jgi:hypothetical protein